MAWRGALPSTPPELIDRGFVDSCAQQQSQDWSLAPGVVSSLTARPFGLGELSWRSARIGDLRGSTGGSRTGIRQVGLSSTSIGNLCHHHLQTRPSLFSGKWIEQIGLQLHFRQHLQGVREDTGAVAAKSEVKWELEMISQVSQERLGNELDAVRVEKCLVVVGWRHVALFTVLHTLID